MWSYEAKAIAFLLSYSGSGGRSPARSHQASTTSKAADGKPVLAAEDTAYLRKELDSMRQEYTELTKLIEVEDTKQKKILEDLKSQLELHRKNASDYQKKIKKLEKLNLKYQQNMDVSQLKKLQEHQHALLTGKCTTNLSMCLCL